LVHQLALPLAVLTADQCKGPMVHRSGFQWAQGLGTPLAVVLACVLEMALAMAMAIV
jgi:hypothetical protein